MKKIIKKQDRILKEFELNKIDYLIYGGIVVGRVFDDIDILVHKNDMGKVKKLMENLGYVRIEMAKYEWKFNKGDGVDVEIRWDLDGLERFNLWEEKEKFTFNPTFHLIYLLVHTAEHIRRKQFKTSYLEDIPYFISRNKINWNRVEKCEIRDVNEILALAKQLLNLNVPFEVEHNYLKKEVFPNGE